MLALLKKVNRILTNKLRSIFVEREGKAFENIGSGNDCSSPRNYCGTRVLVEKCNNIKRATI